MTQPRGEGGLPGGGDINPETWRVEMGWVSFRALAQVLPSLSSRPPFITHGKCNKHLLCAWGRPTPGPYLGQPTQEELYAPGWSEVQVSTSWLCDLAQGTSPLGTSESSWEPQGPAPKVLVRLLLRSQSPKSLAQGVCRTFQFCFSFSKAQPLPCPKSSAPEERNTQISL